MHMLFGRSYFYLNGIQSEIPLMSTVEPQGTGIFVFEIFSVSLTLSFSVTAVPWSFLKEKHTAYCLHWLCQRLKTLLVGGT